MSNDPIKNVVPIEEERLPPSPFSTTPMRTVVGTAQVADCSYDVQGNPINSEGDLPMDVNAMFGVQPLEEGAFQAPSTGFLPYENK